MKHFRQKYEIYDSVTYIQKIRIKNSTLVL